MALRYPLYCGRCGADCSETRGGQLRAEDYIELWQEHCALQMEYAEETARLRDRLAQALEDVYLLRQLVDQLEPPTLEQIEIRELRAALVEPEGAPF